MAASVLFLIGHLSKGAAVLDKDGVVAKAVLPPGLKGNGAVALALCVDALSQSWETRSTPR